MSVQPIPVAFADACAADLGLHLDLPPQDPLLVTCGTGAGWDVQLRILGASHQVLVAGAVSETVACRPAGSGLPARSGAGRYRFSSTVTTLPAPAFAAAVARLLDRLRDDPLAVAGVFPGDGDAVTGLRARLGHDAATWESWHTYPQTGEIVATRSLVRVGADAPSSSTRRRSQTPRASSTLGVGADAPSSSTRRRSQTPRASSTLGVGADAPSSSTRRRSQTPRASSTLGVGAGAPSSALGVGADA